MTKTSLNLKVGSLATAALLLVGVLAAPTASAVATNAVRSTWTSEDGTYRLTEQPSASLTASRPQPTKTDATINIDPAARYQQIFGQGQSLESSSVWNLVHLPPARRSELMRVLFDPAAGNGYNVIRLSLGCSDFCSEQFYTYDDVPDGQSDPTLSRFSIQKDVDAGIIALAREARALNPSVRFFLSMWSAPAWMKSNQSLIGGGSVLPTNYDVLARYQRMAIQAYQAAGVPITAITPQNEPRVITNYPTGEWTGEQMRDYIKGSLGPELERAGLSTEIWVGDDNPPRLSDFVPTILDDPAAARYVDAVAIHDYSGDDPSVLADFELRYRIPIHLTERSYYGINGERNRFDGNLQAGIRRTMELYRNGVSSWTSWLSFLDTAGEPNTGPLRGDCCALPFTAPPGQLGSYTTGRDHYLAGQFSRYVHQGAVRIGSDQTSSDVSNVAFHNPDGTVAVVVANGAAVPRTITLASPDGTVVVTLPGMTVGTYRWKSTVMQVDARLGTFRLVGRGSDFALQNTRETYRGNSDATHAVATPVDWNLLEQRWTITSAGGGYYRVTSASAQNRVLHTTGEQHPGNDAYWNVAAVSSALNWDEQLWRISPTGDGYYRLVNKSRGTALQIIDEAYTHPAARIVVGAPEAANLSAQQFRLLPG